MPAPLDVLVLGDANPDLVLRGGEVQPAFGQAERLVDEAHLTVGGSGAILACGLAKLGLRVGICAVIGSDLFGGFIADELERRGVDTGGLVVEPDRPTGLTVVLSTPEDRGMLTVPGTIADLRAGAIAADFSARHVHVSSYFLQAGLRPGLPGIFERVHDAGGTTSIDPNWDPSGSWDDGLVDLLAATDVFLPNAIEATRVARTSDLTAAVRILGARAGLVVVKDGERGAIGGGGGALVRSPGVRTTVVDTTGAGDAFDAGFLTSWLGGASLEDSLAIANACGALSTRALGGVDGQADMDEARATVRDRSPA
jgi:sugar/nucleoside kinase (ribokinase family)